MKKMLFAGAAALALAPFAISTAVAAPQKGSKIGPALDAVYQMHMSEKAAANSRARTAAPAQEDVIRRNLMARMSPKPGYVAIDAVASGSVESLASALKAAGAEKVTTVGRYASAVVPIEGLAQLRDSAAVKFARPILAKTNVGLTTSQGDRSMRADKARSQQGVDGTGTKVGILSDSFSCTTGTLAGGPWTSTAQDIANNDLPPNVTILEDIAGGCTDEGRGMAQLVHDSAPGASIAFHTAFNGVADFAQGIIDLAYAGSDVIVDDVIYFLEPMLQDGPIAQAADEVARLGVPYFSSAGNNGRTGHGEAFRPVVASPGGFAGTWHDFDPGPGVDVTQTVELANPAPIGGGFYQSDTGLVLNWDQPNFSVSGGAGSASDVDLIMFDAVSGLPVPSCFVDVSPEGFCVFVDQDGVVGADAIEFVELVYFGTDPSPQAPQIGYRLFAGPAPTYAKYVPYEFLGTFAQIEYDTQSGANYGHSNARRAEAVGASAFFLTEEFIGDPDTAFPAPPAPPSVTCVPACLNDFSSAGGTPVFFRPDGTRYGQPKLRAKPGITGPDGGNTSFFFRDTSRDDDDGDDVFQSGEPGEFPNFFGTSASAPAAASIAALMIDAQNSQIIGNNGKARMCRTSGQREGGQTKQVNLADVPAKVAAGWLLGPCDRSEPKAVYASLRKTAQNMTERKSLGDGSTIGVFSDGPGGFDFDSGYGFIDAKKALARFIRRESDDDDYCRDYDDRD